MALPYIEVHVGSHPLQVEVVTKLQDQIRGLQTHTHLPEHHGMLFVFSPPQELRVWMKDTALPLGLAFLDQQANIVYMADLEPYSETVHTWPEPLPFFLEVPQGWFQRHQVIVGTSVQIPEQARWLQAAAPRPIGFRSAS